jgi:hypothetical protein
MLEPPSREATVRLRAWLATAALLSWRGRRAVPIVGVGQLVDKGGYWQLVYEPCGHTLALAKFSDLDPVKQVRRWHASCVECECQQQYAPRPRRAARHRPEIAALARPEQLPRPPRQRQD